jgi:hypothetical protein
MVLEVHFAANAIRVLMACQVGGKFQPVLNPGGNRYLVMLLYPDQGLSVLSRDWIRFRREAD